MQTDTKKHSFYFGEKLIEFDVIRSNRKTLGISVKSDSSVYVRSPKDKSLADVIAKVKHKAPWILKQIDRFDTLRPLISEKEYVSGESFYYLGRQYRLKVISTTDKEEVKMSNGYIKVIEKHNDRERIKYLLDNWYLEKARTYFYKKLNFTLAKVKHLGIQPNSIIIRKLKTRWGSCSRKGNLSLNTHLIKAPSHCIEYVIMHEICHLKYFNHSKDYYMLLNKMMPDWELRKKRIEKVII